MWRMVIGDRRRRDAVLREAKGAERLDPKLVVGALSPALQRVPGTPWERLRGVGEAGGHQETSEGRNRRVPEKYLGDTNLRSVSFRHGHDRPSTRS